MKRFLLLAVLGVLLSLVLCGTASAATAQDIWDDYDDNGVLDGTYTTAELNAYLNNASLHQYPPNASKIQSLDALVRGMLSARNRFPFSGTEIALLAVGALVVLGTGIGLRRMGRAKR